jgi:hypothetical protein
MKINLIFIGLTASFVSGSMQNLLPEMERENLELLMMSRMIWLLG